jgi:hypothetical protein
MSKKQQIFNLLSDGKAHGKDELIPITYRFSAVIHSLREQGHEIKTIPIAHNTWMYQMAMKQS